MGCEKFAVLSIFTVVNFPKDACMTSSGDTGTCMSPPDCLQRGGLPTTPCASNYGVCCVCEYVDDWSEKVFDLQATIFGYFGCQSDC